jgi:GTP-binding protein Era
MNNQKCSISSIVGAPNAGKSTLLNHLLGQKISIVTPKVQTTRSLIRGIYCNENLQAILIDTPGIFSASKKLERSIVRTAYAGLSEGVDFCFHIIDAKKGISDSDQNIIRYLKEKKINGHAILNKKDKIDNTRLLALAKEVHDSGVYGEIFMISAIDGCGVEDIITFLKDNSPNLPWIYEKDEITTAPSKFLASEVTREKLYLELQEELPYNLSVESETFEETDKGIKINQVIYVTKANYKKIIIGKNGAKLKKIGSSAREDLERLFDRKVHLFIFVKVRENWMDDQSIYNYMGMIYDN